MSAELELIDPEGPTEPEPELLAHGTHSLCPKCAYAGLDTFWHAVVILTYGSKRYPCADWPVEHSGLEHLCLRCIRCGHAWATRTADWQEPPS